MTKPCSGSYHPCDCTGQPGPVGLKASMDNALFCLSQWKQLDQEDEWEPKLQVNSISLPKRQNKSKRHPYTHGHRHTHTYHTHCKLEAVKADFHVAVFQWRERRTDRKSGQQSRGDSTGNERCLAHRGAFRCGDGKKGLMALHHLSSLLFPWLLSWNPLTPELSGLQNDPLLLTRILLPWHYYAIGNKEYLDLCLEDEWEKREDYACEEFMRNLENSHQRSSLRFETLCLSMKKKPFPSNSWMELVCKSKLKLLKISNDFVWHGYYKKLIRHSWKAKQDC